MKDNFLLVAVHFVQYDSCACTELNNICVYCFEKSRGHARGTEMHFCSLLWHVLARAHQNFGFNYKESVSSHFDVDWAQMFSDN